MQTTTVMYHAQIPAGPTGVVIEYDRSYLFVPMDQSALHIIHDERLLLRTAVVPADMANFLMETMFAGLLEQLGGVA